MWDWFTTNGVWILAALAIGFILFIIFRRWVEKIVTRIMPAQFFEREEHGQRILARVVIATGGIIILFAIGTVVVATFGIDVMPLLTGIGSWLLQHGTRILLIIAIGYLMQWVARSLIPQIIERSIKIKPEKHPDKEEIVRRAQTLSRVFAQTVTALIIFIVFFMILSEVDIDIAPLLAGAGVVGLAIGFGAQNLIKDILNGIFILVEGQYDVGDVVKVAGIAGLVEDINLRRTVLRDLDGIVHNIPNGEITTSSNYTEEYSRVNFNIRVAYEEDIDRCIAVLNKVGQEIMTDDVFGKMILTAPKVLRVDNFADSGVEIKILGDVKPLKQWDVMGELRKRIKKAFDKEGIEIPWPHTHVKLFFGDDAERGLVCPACRRPNLQRSKFCANCGAALSAEEKPHVSD
jgi:small conductance mechanosensitive channel